MNNSKAAERKIFISIEIENKELGRDTKQHKIYIKKRIMYNVVTHKDIVVYTIENINISL